MEVISHLRTKNDIYPKERPGKSLKSWQCQAKGVLLPSSEVMLTRLERELAIVAKCSAGVLYSSIKAG